MTMIQLTARKCTHQTDPVYIDHEYINQISYDGHNGRDQPGRTRVRLLSGRVVDIHESPDEIRQRILEATGKATLRESGARVRESRTMSPETIKRRVTSLKLRRMS